MLEAAPNNVPIDPSARTARPTPDVAPTDPGDVAAGPADLQPGTMLKGCYRIERRLGAGGMGTVYLARHLEIDKRVAIKILGPESVHRPQLKERFLREARATASIDDEHVIAIHDFGSSPDGVVFFVMEYLQGVDLAEVIKHHAPLGWPRARDITVQICGALAAAHAKGVVHRDMKPANVFRMDRSGAEFIKVLDFGLAKVIRPEKSLGEGLTHTGMLFGTPEYMSPEQAQGDRADHRVDIYALGVILFEMLTGQLPFRSDTFMGMLHKHMFDPPPRPSDVAPHAKIPAAAEAVVLKALQKDPALRFQTMTEMADALAAADTGVAPVVVREKLRTPPPRGAATAFRTAEDLRLPRRRGWWVVAAGLASAGLTALALASTLPTDPADDPVAIELHTPEPDERAPIVGVIKPLATPPAHAARVILRFDTGGVAARIYDEHETMLGDTSSPDGLPLPHDGQPHALSLRAAGYQDLHLVVVPDHDQSVPAPLLRSHKSRPTPKPPIKPEPAPPLDPKADTKAKTKSSPELIPPTFDTL